MIYTHRFTVRAPLAAVSTFHRQSASMGAITPPPIVVRVHEAPPILSAGDRMDFTMWLGPLPVRWVAQIEETEESGFIDRQIRGPFAEWVHRHTFIPVDEGVTEIRDEVKVQLHAESRFWQIVGFSMWLGLPILFAYRGWRTRRLLEAK
jgi:ligand-binding SRPBCC domain-containing protein